MDVPRRIARERVPIMGVGRDLHVFPYVDAHAAAAERDFCGLGLRAVKFLDQLQHALRHFTNLTGRQE
jgi:hypothetical protein